MSQIIARAPPSGRWLPVPPSRSWSPKRSQTTVLDYWVQWLVPQPPVPGDRSKLPVVDQVVNKFWQSTGEGACIVLQMECHDKCCIAASAKSRANSALSGPAETPAKPPPHCESCRGPRIQGLRDLA